MHRKHRERIDLCCEDIVPKINLTKLWPKLFEHKIFDRDDVNVPRWRDNLAREETVRDVYLTVKTRGPQAFQNFLLCLRQTGHEALADMLEGDRMVAMILNESGQTNGEVRSPSTYEMWKEAAKVIEQQEDDDFYNKIQSCDKPLRIKVRKAQIFMDGPEYKNIERYPMRSKPRGLVLIVSNIHYKYFHERPRISAEHDEANLKQLFEEMGFLVVAYRDLTGQELTERVEQFSRRDDLRKVDSCFVIITSHGDENSEGNNTEIQGVDYHATCNSSDYKTVLCTDIMSYFSVEACPHLAGKPKIFIFQLCRGDKKQRAVKAPRHATDTCTSNHVKTDDLSDSCGINNSNTIRNYSDMLVAHATMPGHVAFRDNVTGSWFIQILCEVFMNHACTMHLQDLLNKVDTRLGVQRTIYEECQTLTVKSMGFNKHCYLNPGLY